MYLYVLDGINCYFWKIFCFFFIEGSSRPWTLSSSAFFFFLIIPSLVRGIPSSFTSGPQLGNTVDCLAVIVVAKVSSFAERDCGFQYGLWLGSVS